MRRDGCSVISELREEPGSKAQMTELQATFERRLPEGEREIVLALPSPARSLFLKSETFDFDIDLRCPRPRSAIRGFRQPWRNVPGYQSSHPRNRRSNASHQPGHGTGRDGDARVRDASDLGRP